MKLGLLILIVGFVILLFCLYKHHFSEPFVPGRYVIAWQIPKDKGGDPQCCGYDWQVCTLEDTKCANPVDSGSIPSPQGVPVASTSKVNWGDTYNIMVRAKNSAGTGPWTTAQLTAGGGTLSAITIAQSIAADGTVTTPLSPNSTQVMVWASIAQNQSVSPNTMKAIATVTQIRGGKTIDSVNNEAMVSGVSGGQDTFTLTLTGLSIQVGDVFKAYIYVQTQDGSAFTDGQGSLSISVSAPGSVTGITWAYMPYGSPDSPPPALLGCDPAIQVMNSQVGLPAQSTFATSFMNGAVSAGTTFSQCNSFQKGQIIMTANAQPPSDPSRSCSSALTSANALIQNGDKNEKCGAYSQYLAIQGVSYNFSNPCFQGGPGYGVAGPILNSWGQNCPNQPPPQLSCPFYDPSTGKCMDYTMSTPVCTVSIPNLPSPNLYVLVTGSSATNNAITDQGICTNIQGHCGSAGNIITMQPLNSSGFNKTTVVNTSQLTCT